jgi:chaperonin GroES
MLNLDTTLSINKDLIKSPNLCDRFKHDDLDRIGRSVNEGYVRDRASRSKWERRMNAAMELAMQVQSAKTFPWPGCSNVVFPLVTIAALQFSARAYANIVQGNNVVRYRVIGKDEGSARERAMRIGKHMSWQVTEEDEAWEEEHDRLLINLAIVGTAYIKSWYDPGLGYPVSELVTARDLVMDYWAKSVDRAARVTQHVPLYKNEIYERCLRKTFRDVRDEPWFNQAPPINYDAQQAQTDNREGIQNTQVDPEGAYRLYEQHRWFDFDKDGYAEPYICTIESSSQKVLRIVARFDEEDVERTVSNKILRIIPTKYYTKYSFIPNPEGACLDLGFGVFLGPINDAVNSNINQLIDGGTLQNSMGGLLGRGAKIKGGAYTISPWQWARVESSGDDLRKNVYMFPERQPSEVLFKLLGLLIEYANRVAGTTDATIGENPGQNTPASTFQGMTEQGMQIFGMSFKRVWRALKEELKQRYNLNKKYLPLTKSFGPNEDFIRQEDYKGNPDQVAPVANPRVTSTIMRIQQAAAVKQDSHITPGYDVPEVTRAFLGALEIEGIDRLYPGPDKVPPLPNPKLQVEQAKLQGKSMDIAASKQEWSNRLMEERRVNNAKIAQLEAQAHKLMKEAGTVGIEAEANALEKLINAHKSYGDMINERIQSLIGDSSAKDIDDSDGENVSGMAKSSSNSGSQGVSGQGSSGSNGAMGGGAVSG